VIPDRRHERRGADEVHSWDGHQPLDLWPRQRLLSDQSFSRGDLRVEELDVTDAGINRLSLLQRQLQTGEPLAAFHAEQIRARRLALQPALQHRVDLVL